MNGQLQEFARKTLKEGLHKCTPEQCKIFFQMYALKGGEERTIESVVDEMPHARLDWAMQQVELTLKKNQEKADATTSITI